MTPSFFKAPRNPGRFKLHTEQDLFDRAYGYIREHY